MTVSNHVTAVDDPGMVATLIDAKDFASPSHLRWQMCAADRCFRVRALLPMFRGGRVLPVLRVRVRVTVRVSVRANLCYI